MFTQLLLAATLSAGQPPAMMPQGPAIATGTPYQIPMGQPPGYPTAQGVPASPNLGYVVPTVPYGALQPAQGNAQTPPADPMTNGKNVENGKKDEKDKKEEKKAPPSTGRGNPHGYGAWLEPREKEGGNFFQRLYREYYQQWVPPDTPYEEPTEVPRRALPSPWTSPPFPSSEWQGYPLLGVPNSTGDYPFMKALYGGPWGQEIKDSGIKFQAWATSFGVWGNSHQTNVPASYWITPNTYGLDQLVFKLEKIPDSVQTDHWDWGFRSALLYGIDYRYTTAGGWFSDQLLKHNQLYGWDPVEEYVNVYIPGFLGGTDIRVGRWIACPDIESQYSVDNFLGSHSILFTYDTYTQTGIMVTQKINDQIMLQGVLHAGTDMAPWYSGATPTMAFGSRWVSADNNDAFYTWINALNSAQFRHFYQYGQPLGHDNFNYVVTTYEHRFNEAIITKTELYYMWQFNAEVGGTPSAGPVEPYGGGGGDGKLIPGRSQAYGVLNYTMFGLSDRDYFTIRNEVYRDETGFRTGYAGTYTSHTIGLSHQFNDICMLRPEIGYYRNWNEQAFDNGTKRGTWIYGFDLTLRF
jgi:hypothetical protein